MMALAFLVLAFGNSYATVLIAMLLAGLGMGLMIPNANVWVMQLAPVEIRGREIGRLTTFWFMGQFMSPLLLLPLSEFLDQKQMFLIITAILILLSITFVIMQLSTKKMPAS